MISPSFKDFNAQVGWNTWRKRYLFRSPEYYEKLDKIILSAEELIKSLELKGYKR